MATAILCEGVTSSFQGTPMDLTDKIISEGNDEQREKFCRIMRSVSSPSVAFQDFIRAPVKKETDAVELLRTKSDNIDALLKDACPSYGLTSVVGRRSEMEDTCSIVPSFYSDPPFGTHNRSDGSGAVSAFHFFGVFDGHGGSQASGFCKQRMHELIAEELRAFPSSTLRQDCKRDAEEWGRALRISFRKVDIEVGGICPSGICIEDDETNNNNANCLQCQSLIAPENVGTTAVVGIVTPSQIVVANCGDSRAVLCRAGKAILFSSDHKPQRDDELARIEAAGGRVIYWNGFRVAGFLAMSRAIGDRFLKQFVTSEPEIQCTDRSEDDEFLILASDGIWDVLTNEYACGVVRKCLGGYRPQRWKGKAVSVAAALLTKLALAKGSQDNITVVVVDLRPNHTQPAEAAKAV